MEQEITCFFENKFYISKREVAKKNEKSPHDQQKKRKIYSQKCKRNGPYSTRGHFLLEKRY
ncbi:hypothetical protein FFF34_012795 [Inquilinus sp. KBS0705]|nr:hypothetical protein FFF34_012795 [Inquilinus sp. KBS0705]